MFKTMSRFIAILSLIVCFGMTHASAADVSPTPAPAAASDKGASATTAAAPSDAYINDATPEEAKAMSLRAAAYVREHGPEAALVEFNKTKSEFIQKDLYVFVVDKDGVYRAHPMKPALVGKNMMELKDVDGVPLVKLATEVKDEGWIEYKWSHPIAKAILPKKTYVVHVGDLFICVGAYKRS